MLATLGQKFKMAPYCSFPLSCWLCTKRAPTSMPDLAWMGTLLNLVNSLPRRGGGYRYAITASWIWLCQSWPVFSMEKTASLILGLVAQHKLLFSSFWKLTGNTDGVQCWSSWCFCSGWRVAPLREWSPGHSVRHLQQCTGSSIMSQMSCWWSCLDWSASLRLRMISGLHVNAYEFKMESSCSCNV